MSLLIKKLQQGGLFANPANMDLGARDFTGLLNVSGGRSSGANKAYSTPTTSGKKSKSAGDEPDIKNALPSDIKYYNIKEREITERLEELMMDGLTNDEKVEYDRLIKARHMLTKELYPQLKSFNDLYKNYKKNFDDENVGNTPAIYGNYVFVNDREAKGGESKIKMVTYDELLKNAKTLIPMRAKDVLHNRVYNPEFSGFTQIGQIASTFLDNVYGDESYLKYMNGLLSRLGYYKRKGFIESPDGQKITPSEITVKSNANNIKALITDVLNNADSEPMQYLTAQAINKLYRDVSNNIISLDGKSKEEIDKLVNKYRTDMLITSVKRAVLEDMEFDESSDGGNYGAGGKEVKLNIMQVGAKDMANQTSFIETGDFKIKDRPIKLLYATPAGFINNGPLLLEEGYKKFSINASEVGKPTSNRVLKNNLFISNVQGGDGMITTVDGTNIYDLVNDPAEVTTPYNSAMHIIIAPIEKVGGKRRVNFDSEYADEIAKSMDKVYDQWEKEGIKPELVVKDEAVAKKAEQIATDVLTEELKKKGISLRSGMRLGMAIAFDVIYDTNKPDYRYQWSELSDDEEDLLDNMGIVSWSDWDNPRKTKVFIPLSQSFFSNMNSYNFLDEDYQRKYQSGAYQSVGKSPEVGDHDVAGSISRTLAYKRYQEFNKNPVKEKHGGKLASADDLLKLIL